MATKITPIVRISPPAKGNIWADGKFDAMLTSSAIARSLYLQAKDAKESDPWGRGVLRKHQTNEWKEVSPTSAFTRVEVPELHGLMLAFGGFGLDAPSVLTAEVLQAFQRFKKFADAMSIVDSFWKNADAPQKISAVPSRLLCDELIKMLWALISAAHKSMDRSAEQQVDAITYEDLVCDLSFLRLAVTLLFQAVEFYVADDDGKSTEPPFLLPTVLSLRIEPAGWPSNSTTFETSTSDLQWSVHRVNVCFDLIDQLNWLITRVMLEHKGRLPAGICADDAEEFQTVLRTKAPSDDREGFVFGAGNVLRMTTLMLGGICKRVAGLFVNESPTESSNTCGNRWISVAAAAIQQAFRLGLLMELGLDFFRCTFPEVLAEIPEPYDMSLWRSKEMTDIILIPTFRMPIGRILTSISQLLRHEVHIDFASHENVDESKSPFAKIESALEHRGYISTTTLLNSECKDVSPMRVADALQLDAVDNKSPRGLVLEHLKLRRNFASKLRARVSATTPLLPNAHAVHMLRPKSAMRCSVHIMPGHSRATTTLRHLLLLLTESSFRLPGEAMTELCQLLAFVNATPGCTPAQLERFSVPVVAFGDSVSIPTIISSKILGAGEKRPPDVSESDWSRRSEIAAGYPVLYRCCDAIQLFRPTSRHELRTVTERTVVEQEQVRRDWHVEQLWKWTVGILCDPRLSRKSDQPSPIKMDVNDATNTQAKQKPTSTNKRKSTSSRSTTASLLMPEGQAKGRLWSPPSTRKVHKGKHNLGILPGRRRKRKVAVGKDEEDVPVVKMEDVKEKPQRTTATRWTGDSPVDDVSVSAVASKPVASVADDVDLAVKTEKNEKTKRTSKKKKNSSKKSDKAAAAAAEDEPTKPAAKRQKLAPTDEPPKANAVADHKSAKSETPLTAVSVSLVAPPSACIAGDPYAQILGRRQMISPTVWFHPIMPHERPLTHESLGAAGIDQEEGPLMLLANSTHQHVRKSPFFLQLPLTDRTRNEEVTDYQTLLEEYETARIAQFQQFNEAKMGRRPLGLVLSSLDPNEASWTPSPNSDPTRSTFLCEIQRREHFFVCNAPWVTLGAAAHSASVENPFEHVELADPRMSSVYPLPKLHLSSLVRPYTEFNYRLPTKSSAPVVLTFFRMMCDWSTETWDPAMYPMQQLTNMPDALCDANIPLALHIKSWRDLVVSPASTWVINLMIIYLYIYKDSSRGFHFGPHHLMHLFYSSVLYMRSANKLEYVGLKTVIDDVIQHFCSPGKGPARANFTLDENNDDTTSPTHGGWVPSLVAFLFNSQSMPRLVPDAYESLFNSEGHLDVRQRLEHADNLAAYTALANVLSWRMAPTYFPLKINDNGVVSGPVRKRLGVSVQTKALNIYDDKRADAERKASAPETAKRVVNMFAKSTAVDKLGGVFVSESAPELTMQPLENDWFSPVVPSGSARDDLEALTEKPMERSMEVDLEDVEAKQRRQLDFVPGRTPGRVLAHNPVDKSARRSPLDLSSCGPPFVDLTSERRLSMLDHFDMFLQLVQAALHRVVFSLNVCQNTRTVYDEKAFMSDKAAKDAKTNRSTAEIMKEEEDDANDKKRPPVRLPTWARERILKHYVPIEPLADWVMALRIAFREDRKDLGNDQVTMVYETVLTTAMMCGIEPHHLPPEIFYFSPQARPHVENRAVRGEKYFKRRDTTPNKQDWFREHIRTAMIRFMGDPRHLNHWIEWLQRFIAVLIAVPVKRPTNEHGTMPRLSEMKAASDLDARKVPLEKFSDPRLAMDPSTKAYYITYAVIMLHALQLFSLTKKKPMNAALSPDKRPVRARVIDVYFESKGDVKNHTLVFGQLGGDDFKIRPEYWESKPQPEKDIMCARTGAQIAALVSRNWCITLLRAAQMMYGGRYVDERHYVPPHLPSGLELEKLGLVNLGWVAKVARAQVICEQELRKYLLQGRYPEALFKLQQIYNFPFDNDPYPIWRNVGDPAFVEKMVLIYEAWLKPTQFAFVRSATPRIAYTPNIGSSWLRSSYLDQTPVRDVTMTDVFDCKRRMLPVFLTDAPAVQNSQDTTKTNDDDDDYPSSDDEDTLADAAAAAVDAPVPAPASTHTHTSMSTAVATSSKLQAPSSNLQAPNSGH